MFTISLISVIVVLRFSSRVQKKTCPASLFLPRRSNDIIFIVGRCPLLTPQRASCPLSRFLQCTFVIPSRYYELASNYDCVHNIFSSHDIIIVFIFNFARILSIFYLPDPRL